MIVYRLTTFKYRLDLSGKGAQLFGGRWNSPGRALLYCSVDPALCLAEVKVHLPAAYIPVDYQLLRIEIPDVKDEVIETDQLPFQWQSAPNLATTRSIGDDFLERAACLFLRVPSAVVQRSVNILVNPDHPDFQQVRLIDSEPFRFDPRLF